jgi:hypothetical protein
MRKSDALGRALLNEFAVRRVSNLQRFRVAEVVLIYETEVAFARALR